MSQQRVFRGAVFGGFVALVAGGASCTSLPDIEAGTCGNGVVEPDHNEDCDNALTDDGGKAVCYPPGSAAPCHYDCSVSGCPTGFSCGADQVCRKPKGIFAELGHGTQVDAENLLVGDFDRDGLGDVVARTNVQMNVLYGDPTGLGGPFTIRASSSNPAVGQLAFDPAAAEPVTNTGLIFPVGGGGITTWLGKDDRKLEPIPYPSFQLSGDTVHVFEARVLDATDDIIAFIGAQSVVGRPGGFFIAISSTDTPNAVGAFDYEPSHAPADIVGDIQVANIDERPTSPCDEFTAAFTGEAHISVFTTCSSPTSLNTFGIGTGTQNPPILPTQIALVGATVRADGLGVRTADINGDGHVDLFLDAQDASGTKLTLATYGVGDGTFNADPALAGPINTAFPLFTIEAPVLAIGQLTAGDTAFDYVTRNAIFFQENVTSDDGGVSDGGIGVATAVFADQPWTDAKIADMDGDQALDVVAGAEGRVDYYRGSGTVLLTHIPFAVDGTAGAFTVGLFDDDLAPDIALRAVHDNKDPKLVTADLDILWGRFLSTPEDPTTVGHFGPIASIGSGIIAGAGGNDDFFSDLGVVVGNSAVPFSISVLASSADRQLQAPLYLQQSRAPVAPPDPRNGGKQCTAPVVSTRHTGLAYAFAVGQFNADDRHPDLVTAAGVATNTDAGDLFLQDLELVVSKTTNAGQLIDSNALADSSGNSGLLYTLPFDTYDGFEPGTFIDDPSVPCAPIAGSPARLASADWRNISMVGVDLDGPSDTGVDEIVGVAPALRTSVGFAENDANTFHDTAASGQFFWAKNENGTWAVKSIVPLGVLPKNTNQPAIANVQAADLNGDGAKDVLLLTSGKTSNTLVAYINQKNGQLPATPTLISLPSYATGATETPFTIVSVAPIDADANPGKEVALLTDKGGLFLATSNAAGDVMTVTGPLCKNAEDSQCVNSPNARLPSGTAIAATDVDGDGVEDLVVESSSTLRVFKGVAVDP